MQWIMGAHGDDLGTTLAGDLLETLPLLTFMRNSLVYRDVVSKLGPYSATRINPISSIAAIVSLVRSGYGVATLPRAAVWREVASGELVVLDVEPHLAPVPVVVLVRNPSESPIAQTVASLAADAARAFASGPLAPFVTVPA